MTARSLWPPGQAVGISPWQAQYYRPGQTEVPRLARVLDIRPAWFLEARRRASSSLRFGRVGVEVTDHMARLVCGAAHAMADPDGEDPLFEDRLCTLTEGAFDQFWQWTDRGAASTGPDLPTRDFRIRKALRSLQARLGEISDLDTIARDSGLSRPHFHKLFRAQVGWRRTSISTPCGWSARLTG